MRQEALVILADDVLARRLAACWPDVGVPWPRRTKAVARWARLAALPEVIVERKAPTLFGLGICRPDNTLAPEAARFLTACAVEQAIGRHALKPKPREKPNA